MEGPVWRCVNCGHEEDFKELYRCPRCSGELTLLYDYKGLAQRHDWQETWGTGKTLWERFTPLLPPIASSAVVTLGEGNTPLVKSRYLGRLLGLKELYFKLELCNPTGSFKDRQIAIAFCKAIEWGHRAFGIASSGNAGVALAAYCAKAGTQANVWASREVPASKLHQIQIYGARLFLLPDPKASGDMLAYYAAYTQMQEFCLAHCMVPMVTARCVNPLVVEGAKTIAFEVVIQLGQVPNKVFLPIGGGGLCGGTWKGFQELYSVRLIDSLPRLYGAQYSGVQHMPIDRIGDSRLDPQQFYVPLDGKWALESIQHSGGQYLGMVHERIGEAQWLLASREGIFAEPAGVASVAALLEAADRRLLRNSDIVVCYITGHGLKDLEAAEGVSSEHGEGQRVEIPTFEASEKYFCGPHVGDSPYAGI